MKKILILHFQCLNNYGSGMMGLIVLNELSKRYPKGTIFYSDFNNYTSIDDIKGELSNEINLKTFIPKEIEFSRYKWMRSIQKRKYLVDGSEIKDFNEIIVLGGDDLSEYYTDKIYRTLLKYWRWSKSKPVTLLGQSIGPFQKNKNRFVVKYFLKNIPIFVRDYWSKEYLEKEFGLNKNLHQGADLAFLDLPMQHDLSIETEILKKYNLSKNEYLCIIISGLQGKYYTPNKEKYFEAFRNLIKRIKQNSILKNHKIVLLAHTFPPHGNEGELVENFYNQLTLTEKENIVPISDKILETRARFILGNGRLTITGRMHAAVSTFQMGKPAISLSYSAKYKGVIGMNLGREDLIIESNKSELWDSGEIVNLIVDKIDYLLVNYESLTIDIKEKIKIQKSLVIASFDSITN